MLNKFIAASLLLTTSTVWSGSINESAVMKDDEKTITLAMDKDSWSYAAAAPKGMSKVREFHDMGATGVQQIDYVVNCTNGMLALASFKVLTAMTGDAGAPTAPSIDSVAFYKPVIQHDMRIVENICGSRMASSSTNRMN